MPGKTVATVDSDQEPQAGSELEQALSPPAEDALPDSDAPGEGDATELEVKRELLDRVQQLHGVDLSTKYADDDALLAGLVNAQALASRRDRDAEHGRELVDLLGGREAELKAFLAGQTQPAQATATTEPFDPAKARTQMQRSEQGDLEPLPGAPPGIVQQYQQYEDELRTFIEKFHREGVRVFQQELKDQIAEQVSEQTGRQTAEQREAMALERWGQDNAELLHVGGNPNGPLSLLGQKVSELLSTSRLLKVDEGKDLSLDRIELAFDLAKAAMPQAKTSTSSAQGKRRAETAPAIPDNTPRAKDGEGLAETLARVTGMFGQAVG